MAAFGCTITVDTGKIPSSQSNFVWLATESNFPTAAKDGSANSIDNGGGNLRCYTDDTKVTQLPIEVVTFVTGGTPSVQVWGLSPTLNVASTVYIEADEVATTQPAVGAAFGRNATWVDYRAVYHLNETANNSAGGYIDSTGNGYDGTGVSMSLANRTTAPYGGSTASFNGTADHISLPTTVYPTTEQSDFTVTAWVQPDTLSQDQRVLNLGDSTGNDDVLTLWMDKDAGGTGWAAITKVGDPPSNFIAGIDDNNAQAGRWDFVGTAVSSSQIQALVNGAVSDTTAITEINIGRAINEAFIGRLTSTYMDGSIGSLKISLETKSTTYITSEYNNQSDPSTFWTTSAWVEQGGGGVSIPVIMNQLRNQGIQ